MFKEMNLVGLSLGQISPDMPEIIASFCLIRFRIRQPSKKEKIYFHNLFTFRRKKYKNVWFSLSVIVSAAVSVPLLVFDIKVF